VIVRCDHVRLGYGYYRNFWWFLLRLLPAKNHSISVCVCVCVCLCNDVSIANKKRLIQYDRNLLMLINNYSKHHSLYELSHNINLMDEYIMFTRQTVLSVSAETILTVMWLRETAPWSIFLPNDNYSNVSYIKKQVKIKIKWFRYVRCITLGSKHLTYICSVLN
jgi:hypothetical protein